MLTNVTPHSVPPDTAAEKHRFRDKILILEPVFPLLHLDLEKSQTMDHHGDFSKAARKAGRSLCWK